MQLRFPALLALFFAALLTLSGCGALPLRAPEAGGEFRLTLLHVNDHHSHLDEEALPFMLQTSRGRERIEVAAGGFARVTAAMKEISAGAPNVIKIHAGDALTGDLYYLLYSGEADAALMNTVCFDAFTIGNHEFDDGDAALRRFIDFLHAGACRTPVLSANIRFGAGSALNPRRAPGYVLPSIILKRGGRTIGLIGITAADKTRHSSRPDPDTAFLPETEAAQAEIDRLRGQGVDIIVLQTHYGYRADLGLAGRLRGVNAIVGGDSHTLLGPATLAAYGVTPQGDYPSLARDRDGKLVCVVQAGQYAYVVGQLDLRFDARGELQGCAGTPHILIGDDFRPADRQRPPLGAAGLRAIRDDVRASGVLRITAPDAQAQRILAPFRARKLAFGAAVVAHAPRTFCARRVPGPWRDRTRSAQGDACNADPRVIAHGGQAQQLVAEAFLQQGQAYFRAEIALINAGGVRTDIPQGPVTAKAVYTMLPFRNTLVQLKLPGAQLKAALEDAIDAVLAPAPSTGAYPYAAGLRWTLDARQPKGRRLSGLQVRDGQGRYRPFDPGRIYNVATISFLADGRDHYAALASLDKSRRMDVGLEYAETFLRYVRSLPGKDKMLAPVPAQDYSTQAFIDTPAGQGRRP